MTNIKKHAIVPSQELYELFSDSSVISDEAKAFWLERFSAIPQERYSELAALLRGSQKELDAEYDAYIAAQAEVTAKCERHLGLLATQSRITEAVPAPKKKKNYVDEVLDDTFVQELNKYDH